MCTGIGVLAIYPLECRCVPVVLLVFIFGFLITSLHFLSITRSYVATLMIRLSLPDVQRFGSNASSKVGDQRRQQSPTRGRIKQLS